MYCMYITMLGHGLKEFIFLPLHGEMIACNCNIFQLGSNQQLDIHSMYPPWN